MNGTFRVGRREVWVDPETKIAKPAFLVFIWTINERTDPPVFGSPELSDNGLYAYEEYEKATVVHVVGDKAKEADPTIRIVCKDSTLVPLWDEVERELRDHIALIEYAHHLGLSKKDQAVWINWLK